MGVAAKVLTNPAISREALRVLGVLVERVDWANRVYIQVQEIAEELGIAQPNASRGLAVLRAQGIVTRVRQGAYELHPELMHVGTLAAARKRQQARVAQDSRTKEEA